ncbi:hypothetical protein Tco_0175043 [Tanacetum coccineum]
MYKVFVVIMAGNTVKDMTTNFGKLDKFEGHDFRRWQKKMNFLLTTLKVVYLLTTLMPELLKDATVEAIRIRAKWENDDYICRGHILNGMSDSLFDVYTNVELAKELWDSFESKYMVEDSSSKKFLTGHFKRDCRSGNKKNANAGGSGKGSKDHSQDQYRCWFKTYEPVEDGSVLYMGDDHFAPVHGKGNVVLEFSSGKSITLFNVFIFGIWKAFGGNTRDLGSFGEETDKTTDLHQYGLRISLQWLETALQIQRNAVTMMIKMVSQVSKTASEHTTQPII